MNSKHIAAVASLIALVTVSGCASFADVTVSTEDQGQSIAGTSDGNEILDQMHADSQRGGE